MGLTIGRAAADERPGTRRKPRIYHIDIECDSETARGSRGDLNSIVDACQHSSLVDIAHREKVVTHAGFSLGANPSNSTRSCSPRPRRTERGMPWMLPDGEVSGVFMSAWASNQISPTSFPWSRKYEEIAEKVPIAMEI